MGETTEKDTYCNHPVSGVVMTRRKHVMCIVGVYTKSREGTGNYWMHEQTMRYGIWCSVSYAADSVRMRQSRSISRTYQPHRHNTARMGAMIYMDLLWLLCWICKYSEQARENWGKKEAEWTYSNSTYSVELVCWCRILVALITQRKRNEQGDYHQKRAWEQEKRLGEQKEVHQRQVWPACTDSWWVIQREYAEREKRQSRGEREERERQREEEKEGTGVAETIGKW